jgi:hypothetical protein
MDAYSNEPIPSWPLRKQVVQLLDDVKNDKLTVPVAREALMYMFSMAFKEGYAEAQADNTVLNQ